MLIPFSEILNKGTFLFVHEYKYNNGEIIQKSLQLFKEINALYIDNVFEEKAIDYTYMDYEDVNDILDKNEIIEKFIMSNKIKKHEIKQNQEYISYIAKELKEKCRMTQQEIADELGVNRMKIARLINK